MKKLLILCLTIGMALCTFVGCVKTNNTNKVTNDDLISSYEKEISYWQEMVDNWCIRNLGAEWYGVITAIDEWEGYVSFIPTCRQEGLIAGEYMVSKYTLKRFYSTQNNE